MPTSAKRASGRGPFSYENLLLGLLGLTQGCMFFDRLALNFLSPVIMTDLHLSNTDIGLLATALGLSWAASGFLIGLHADRSGRRKTLLVFAVLTFSISSVLGGFAVSFLSLIGARIVMGLAEGPILPISQTLMADASQPSRRGFNMGFLQNFSTFLIGQFLGSIVSTQLSAVVGWRATFFVAAAPGLLLGLIMWRRLRPDRPAFDVAPPALAPPALAPPVAAIGSRNSALCIGLAASFGSWMILQVTFLPVYLTRVSGLDVRAMGFVMSMMGLAGVIAAIAVPALSDRFGRKPVVTVATLCGLITPLSILFLKNDVATLSGAIFLGSLSTGVFPLYIAIIPAESLPLSKVTRTIGLTSAAAEIMGGAVLPSVGGLAADHFGLAAIIWMIAGLAAIAALLSLFLVETAPRITGRRRPRPVEAETAALVGPIP